MRYLFGVMVLVLMALPLAWFYVAMFWGFTVSKDIAAFERGEDVLLPTAAPLRWLDDRTELRDAFTLDEITPARYIATRIELPFAEMLNPGEAMPKRELKDLYATLRAPALFAPLCDEILGHLATACDVGSFEGEVRHTGDREGPWGKKERPEDGEAILHGRVRYVPAYAMGDPSIVPNGDLVSARIDLLDEGHVDNTPEGRRELFARALSLCGGLRVRFGNCVIRSVTLQPDQSYRNTGPNPYLDLRGKATFLVFADRTKYREASVRQELERIAATRTAAIETMRRFLP